MNWRIAMETTRLWLEESNITDDLISWKSAEKVLEDLRCLRGVAKHCSQTLDNKDSQWYAICIAAGFGPYHTSGKSQKLLSANFYDNTGPNVWPPNSPDLNPMDYYVCGAVEKDTNRRASTTKSQLIDTFWDPSQGNCNISLLQVPEQDWGCDQH